MIAEVLLVLAGHSSSLFDPKTHQPTTALAPLLHPGEHAALSALGRTASLYSGISTMCEALMCRKGAGERYVCALAAEVKRILKKEYESLVVETERRVLGRDESLVGSGAEFGLGLGSSSSSSSSSSTTVPLSAIRALFSPWDAPLSALSALLTYITEIPHWTPGALIDLLLARSHTGVQRTSALISRLAASVQRLWLSQLVAFVVHGSLSPTDPLASPDGVLKSGSVPSCVSERARDGIEYVGKAILTVKSVKWEKQVPRKMGMEHTQLLEGVLPEEIHAFEGVVERIRTDVGEWLWENVLTRKDVDDAVDSLANYFLLRNGEFSLSLIREIERLKMKRLTSRTASMIREQDLNLALLRASLGTTAQHDPYLSRLRFLLPNGPLRPLLPSLTNEPISGNNTLFDSVLLGTPLALSYNLSWPLELFLDRADLTTYASIFSLLSALRKTQTNVHTCWTSLSNAQRARRRWTGLDEGGAAEAEHEVRGRALRCGWGVIREMGWFLDTVVGYIMMDVVETEFRALKVALEAQGGRVDFSTLRTVHSAYLARVADGCMLTQNVVAGVLKQVLDVCERFVGVVERWGGDVLPGLLGDTDEGDVVRERWAVVAETEDSLRGLLETFYETLMAQQAFAFAPATDASKSVMMSKSMAATAPEESRRHVERLLLRLDFNGALSNPRRSVDILAGL